MKTAGPILEFRREYWWLSNFYRLPNGLTVEHEFQAAKALHEHERKWVLEAPTPGEARRRGRRVTLRPDWEQVKVKVMRGLLRKKFTVPFLKHRLLATGDAQLVEGNSWGDVEWGVYNGKGKNLLGKLLMQLREELRTGYLSMQ